MTPVWATHLYSGIINIYYKCPLDWQVWHITDIIRWGRGGAGAGCSQTVTTCHDVTSHHTPAASLTHVPLIVVSRGKWSRDSDQTLEYTGNRQGQCGVVCLYTESSVTRLPMWWGWPLVTSSRWFPGDSVGNIVLSPRQDQVAGGWSQECWGMFRIIIIILVHIGHLLTLQLSSACLGNWASCQ